MPIYAYACASCGHELETLQKLSEAALTQCPECNEEALRKQLTAPVFRLKGSGWYETDFKKDGKRNLADSAKGEAGTAAAGGDSGGSGSAGSTAGDSAAAGKSESKGESKSESKSEGKSESKSETKSEPKKDSKPAASSASKASSD